MKKLLRAILVPTLASLLALPAFAQGASLNSFTYQGRLNDSSGPANGLFDFSFALFPASTGGSQIGTTVTRTFLPVTNGLFTVPLEFLDANSFSGADRWIEIAVQPSGVGTSITLIPRQQITAAPYAIKAREAATVPVGTITGAMLAAGAVTTSALANGAVTSAKVATVTNWSAHTIANPTPAASEGFGRAVAAMGNDRLLVGTPQVDSAAQDSGAAYLLDTDGIVLATFLNPTLASVPSGEQFGNAVAAVGSDRVLIGADNAMSDINSAFGAGAAYLFDTNGTLLVTFRDPSTAYFEYFGRAVTAVGSDRVLIGAPGADSSPPGPSALAGPGKAYLFGTNGTLLATFLNPTPANGDGFGVTVAAMGNNLVLIGAYGDDTGATDAGVAYLFSTNGTLITTFINPAPAESDGFGNAVVAVGSDRVLIGAYLDNAGAADAGAAYLFRTNGTLLATFSNPTPVVSDQFGQSVAAVGIDRVLIGAYGNDTGATDAGAAYLFRSDGTLLATFANPTPAASDVFGISVTAVGSDRVLIGATWDDTGATDAGAAYLFSLESYAAGLLADSVNAGSITTSSLRDGAVTASKIGGALWPSQIPALSPSHIPNLDAAKITSGTFSDARLSANVALRAGGNTFTGNQTLMGSLGIGVTPLSTLDVNGATTVRGVDGWDVNNTDGDLRVGSTTHRFKIGVAQGGGGAGDVWMRAHGGTARMFIKTPGGTTFFSNEGQTTGVSLAGGGGAWTTLSDRNMKENFTPINAQEVLAQVAALPLSTWNYKSQEEGIRHLGPMAQDFKAAFGLGESDTGITTVDADGVALAAIQGLNQKLEDMKAEAQRRDAENAELKLRLQKLEQLMNYKLNGGAQ